MSRENFVIGGELIFYGQLPLLIEVFSVPPGGGTLLESRLVGELAALLQAAVLEEAGLWVSDGWTCGAATTLADLK